MELANVGFMVEREIINNRLVEKLCCHTGVASLVWHKKMKQAIYQWAVAYSKLEHQRIGPE